MPSIVAVHGSLDAELRIQPIVRALHASALFHPMALSPAPSGEQPTDQWWAGAGPAPDIVLVHGGTRSALAAARAATERGIPVVHLDAGRHGGEAAGGEGAGDEGAGGAVNEPVRRALGRIASLHLAPTEHAKRMLLASAVPEERIVVVGDTIVDALPALRGGSLAVDPTFARALAGGHPVVLIAVHRAHDRAAILRVGAAIRVLAGQFPSHLFVFIAPPSTLVHAGLTVSSQRTANVYTPPVPPFAGMVRLVEHAVLVLTDYSEVEEIAPSLDTPVLVLATTTERPEGVLAGTARVVGTDVETIVGQCAALLSDPARHEEVTRRASPFGDGRSSDRVVAALAALVGRGERLPDFLPDLLADAPR